MIRQYSGGSCRHRWPVRLLPPLITAQVLRTGHPPKILVSNALLDGDALDLIYPRIRRGQDGEAEETKSD